MLFHDIQGWAVILLAQHVLYMSRSVCSTTVFFQRWGQQEQQQHVTLIMLVMLVHESSHPWLIVAAVTSSVTIFLELLDPLMPLM